MESAKDVGKNVEVNEYQDSLNELYENATNGEDVYIKQKHIKGITECRDVLQELVDKATPKKPIVEAKETKYKKSTIHEHIPHCPICNTRLFLIGACCPNNECRQAIDWSKDE